ncbi:MAG: sodium-dependent transporter [Bacteroidetes bacterium]|nr:sodium-dependent transporter [Bacteroidota bacterium]MDA0874709.1 sodium-dependent transporter [Bacteroidota bacterium]
MATAGRGEWSGKLGFILAAAGSAIGLGNIWRFPYTAGENGGGAFVLVYLFFVLVIGIPVVLAELSIGRFAKLNPVGALKKIAPGTKWSWLGGLGVLTGFGILAFYSVVAGWTLSYLWGALTGHASDVTSAEETAAVFNHLIGGSIMPLVLTAIFMALTIFIVRGGVSGGIERATKILMPTLLVVLIIMAIRSMTLDGGSEGIAYLFKPDFSKLSVGVILAALGQALFSLSLGMGAMITYGSYFPDRENLPQAGIIVAFFDTAIAFLAGLIIFPALFSVGVDPNGGPGLVFVILPSIFAQLPAGNLFAVAFYFLLAIAALTSTISLLEVVVSYFVDEKQWDRKKAALWIGLACFGMAVPSALSQGAVGGLTDFLGTGISFLDLQNIIWGNYSLSFGALMLCIFVGWKWGIPAALGSLESSGHRLAVGGFWSILVRYVCPVAVGAILVYIIITQQYF